MILTHLLAFFLSSGGTPPVGGSYVTPRSRTVTASPVYDGTEVPS